MKIKRIFLSLVIITSIISVQIQAYAQEHTFLISLNYGGPQNNPFEFKSLSDHKNFEKIYEEAYNYMLKLGKEMSLLK